MFGGHGLYLDDVMFALAYAGELWLKADGDNRALYLEGGGRPFTYLRQGKRIEMSYVSVPAAVFDDPHRLVAWAERAVAAALRARRGKR